MPSLMLCACEPGQQLPSLMLCEAGAAFQAAFSCSLVVGIETKLIQLLAKIYKVYSASAAGD